MFWLTKEDNNLSRSLMIYLSKGFIALIDLEDAHHLGHKKWCVDSGGYVINGRRRLHRVVLGITDAKVSIDHINGDKLDNRKSNLRIVTASQNQMNAKKRCKGTSKYKGVSWNSTFLKWNAVVYKNKKAVFCRYFKTEDEAAKAYNAAALTHFGEYARLNEVV